MAQLPLPRRICGVSYCSVPTGGSSCLDEMPLGNSSSAAAPSAVIMELSKNMAGFEEEHRVKKFLVKTHEICVERFSKMSSGAITATKAW